MESEIMNCEQVRERVQNPEIVIQNETEATRFLRHVRTCQICRESIPSRERASAVHAIVMAINE